MAAARDCMLKSARGPGTIPPAVRAAIPAVYARLGSKAATARALGIAEGSVRAYLDALSTEEWERVQSLQLQEIIRGSAEVVIGCLAKIKSEDSIADMSVREAIGAYKIMGEQVRAWGYGPKAQQAADESIDAFVAAARIEALERACRMALAEGSTDVLRAVVSVPEDAARAESELVAVEARGE